MAQSTGGMAVLLLLCALSAPATAALGIFQSRVTYDPIRIEEFRVEGVASVSIGGAGANMPDFFFDCNTTKNNGAGIQWSRVGGLQISTEPGTYSGLRLQLEDVDYPDLDVYICTDTNTGDSLELNITISNPAVCPVRDISTTLQGGLVELKVYVSSYPLLTGSQIHWYRPNGNEIFASEPNVQFVNSRKSLILSNVQLADFGRYEVEGLLTSGPIVIGRDRTGITLDIQVPSQIQTQPVNETTILEREPFSLSCTASGNPAPTITWVREDGSDLNTMATMNTQSNPSLPLAFVTSTLSVPFALYSDSGRYRCSANNDISNPVLSDFSDITVRPTIFLTDSSDQPLSNTDVISQSDGSEFLVKCYGSGNIMWTSSNGVVIPNNQSGTLYQTFDSIGEQVSLVFTSFSPNEVAVYTCESPLNDVNNVPITDSVLITNSDPAVFITTTVMYVLEGDSVSIEAGIYFSSTSKVQWFLGDQLLDIDTISQLSQTIEGNLYTLNIDSINSQLLGLYTVVVTREGQNASDSVTVSYASPPTVTLSVTELTVTEGEEARVQCIGEGVGAIRIRWYYDNKESVLQSGSDLVIPSVASTHTGLYECRVSNIADTVTKTVQITVRYMPFSMIQYNSISSMSSPIIFPIFGESTIAPVFMCTSNGYPEPTITWRATSETGFPNGVTTQAEGQELVWTRPFEYTDSMQYECVSENELGTSITTMNLLVPSAQRIDSIYSTQLSSLTSNSYQVPTGFTGFALTCLAFGWPAPYVEWLYNDNALPEGVDSSQTFLTGTHMGQVSAKLRFRTGFNSNLSGAYQCVVKDSKVSSVAVNESRELIETGDVTSTTPPRSCSVSNSLVNFQIRILETDCTSWGDTLRQSIANAFEDEIMSIIQLECNCTVSSDFVQTLELPTCSTMINNGVVFRGKIETNSVDQTENVFCALSTWQQSSPSVNINGQLFVVDSDCSIRLDSFSNPECVASEPVIGIDNKTLIIVIAAPIGAVVVVVMVILIVCCVSCHCRKLKKTWKMPSKREGTSQYSRTDPRYNSRNNHVVGPIDETTGGPVYSTLERNLCSPNYRSPLTDESPEHLPLQQTGSLSKDFLIQHSSRDRESLDGEDIHYLHTESAIDITATSTSGVRPSVRQFPYDSQPSSGSSSRVTSPPQRGPSRTVLSATNPMPDYEELNYNYKGSPTDPHLQFSRKESSSDSVTERKFSLASNSPSLTTGTGPHPASSLENDVFSNGPNSRSGPMGPIPPISTAYLRNITSRSSIDNGSASPAVSSRPSDIIDEEIEIRRDSNCSEEPPPYSSRPPSGMTPSSSMLDNSAYGRVDPAPIHEDERWYISSDASLDSNRPDTRRINGRIDDIQPYASIHNSAIPYEPQSIIRQQTEHRSYTSSASRFRVPVERKRQHIPQPYSEAMLSQTSESGTPQPYSEAVPMRSSVGSLVSQGSFAPSRNVTNFEITV